MPGQEDPEDDVETARGAPVRTEGPPSPPKKLKKHPVKDDAKAKKGHGG